MLDLSKQMYKENSLQYYMHLFQMYCVPSKMQPYNVAVKHFLIKF